jgi:hypothetical protein
MNRVPRNFGRVENPPDGLTSQVQVKAGFPVHDQEVNSPGK